MTAAPSPEDLLEVALEAAWRAGAILTSRFGGERTVEYKGGIDVVTDADKASEVAIIDYLRGAFPDHAVLAEESGASASGQGYRWIIDPLDGTTNYLHRVPHFSVSIAVEGPEGLLAGVVLDPLRNECFAARRGGGATLNGRHIEVTRKESLDRALLCTGFPYDVREKPDAPVGLFNRLITRAQGMRRMGSAALDLAYVACGRFDGYFEFGLKAWDLAAGALLITEAGGRIARIDGAPLDLAVGDVLASGPGLYDLLREETHAFVEEIRWKPRRQA